MTNNQINYAKLNEERRHNLASEGISQYSTDVQRDQAVEVARHNLAMEKLNWYDAGTRRQQTEGQISRWQTQDIVDQYNADSHAIEARAAAIKAGASQQDAQTRREEVEEKIRHDFADEELRRYATDITAAIDRAQVEELARHNLALEALNDFKNQIDAGVAKTESFRNVMSGISDALNAGANVVEAYLKARGKWYERSAVPAAPGYNRSK
jgi:hypothetical protein